MLGVFILEFRTLIAVGYTFLKSSSLSFFCQQELYDFHLSARASHAEGQRENLKGESKKTKTKQVCVLKGGRALTGLTHTLTLMALGEQNRTSFPRGPQRVREGRETEEGVNCQRLLSALKQGLERAEGTVSPLEVVSALVTLSCIAQSCGQLCSFRMRSHNGLCSTVTHLDVVTWINSQTSEPLAPACCDVKKQLKCFSMLVCQASERFLSRSSQQHTAGYKVLQSHNRSNYTKLLWKSLKIMVKLN